MGQAVIVGTAGHVDHGKSALVEALTGRRMDRLAEERRRGITIELNFAPLILSEGVEAGLVDVPGHEDFVQNMVAGASGLDLVLLIIAADEGLMPQTREHRAIVEQLGVPDAIPVITKSDLADPEWLALLADEIVEWTAQSPIRFSAPLAVSARTGAGIEELRRAIGHTLRRSRRRDPGDLFRMPIDRVFSVAGTGTVITGTTWSGQVKVGQDIRLLPSDLTARVRSIECFGKAMDRSVPGARTAIGLAGIDRDQVSRGDLAVAPDDPWQPSVALDVALELLPEAGDAVKERARIRIHHGTREVMGRLHPREGSAARIVLETPLTVRGGDRLVLRSFSPVTTIGGARVLDPAPPRRGATWPPQLTVEEPSKRLEALVSRRRWGLVERDVPVILGPVGGNPAASATGVSRLGNRLVAAHLIHQMKEDVIGRLTSWHKDNPFEPGMPVSTLRQALGGPVADALLDSLVEAKTIERQDAAARLPGFRPRARGSVTEVERLVTRIEKAGLMAPAAAELGMEVGRPDMVALLKAAAQAGRLVAVTPDWFLSPAALEGFVVALRETAATGTITPAGLRERTGLSRKFLIPLLEWADRAGYTRREGEGRSLVSRP
jgi:selenocysteine-specific elongation factor